MPDGETAAILSSMVDRARSAMGWGALPQTSVRGEQSPQDLAIIAWYEVLYDAGVPVEHYNACYRSAGQRKRELATEGKKVEVMTPYEVAAEWDKVRRMHAELDKSRLLPENAASKCLRCYGTGREEMPDNTVRDGCSHEPLTEEEHEQRRQKRIEFMRGAMERLARPMPEEPKAEAKVEHVTLTCTECRRESSTAFGWKIGETCKARIPGPVREDERLECSGKMMNW